MTEDIRQALPVGYTPIISATEKLGFTMASDVMTCCFLRTLAASKPGGKFLELGTGTGLSTCWILDGMDHSSTLISIDNEARYQNVARNHLGMDHRLTLECVDGADWFATNSSRSFDYIFADTWHGKYIILDMALAMLNKGGLYIIDDMLPQPNWPDGHYAKSLKLISDLEARKDLHLVKQAWATGLIVAVKK
jgi:predicted O-methyltransferase YrrM